MKSKSFTLISKVLAISTYLVSSCFPACTLLQLDCFLLSPHLLPHANPQTCVSVHAALPIGLPPLSCQLRKAQTFFKAPLVHITSTYSGPYWSCHSLSYPPWVKRNYCIRDLISPYPNTLLSDLLILIALVNGKFLILISNLVANDIKHIFFVCLLATCLASFQKCLFRSFAHFLI